MCKGWKVLHTWTKWIVEIEQWTRNGAAILREDTTKQYKYTKKYQHRKCELCGLVQERSLS